MAVESPANSPLHTEVTLSSEDLSLLGAAKNQRFSPDSQLNYYMVDPADAERVTVDTTNLGLPFVLLGGECRYQTSNPNPDSFSDDSERFTSVFVLNNPGHLMLRFVRVSNPLVFLRERFGAVSGE